MHNLTSTTNNPMQNTMTSHQLTAMLQHTRHAYILTVIRRLAKNHGFDIKAMESTYLDAKERKKKQYIVPPALCEIFMQYRKEIIKLRATTLIHPLTPLDHAVTPTLAMADEVVATLNRNPSEPLRLSRIAVQFECSQYDVAKALEPVVAAGRIKCRDGVYAAKTYKW